MKLWNCVENSVYVFLLYKNQVYCCIQLTRIDSDPCYLKHIRQDVYADQKVLDMWNEDQCNCGIRTENLITKWYEREKYLM